MRCPVIPFAPQDLTGRSWSANATPFGIAPNAPFIGSFHPQIPQALIPSYASSPWLGSSLNAFGASPWTGNPFTSINPLSLAALQSGFVSPLSGWQNLGLPFHSLSPNGISDLSPYALAARQAYLPGFYPSNFFAGGHPALGGSYLGAGFQQPAFSA
jgi:hypothetical protein